MDAGKLSLVNLAYSGILCTHMIRSRLPLTMLVEYSSRFYPSLCFRICLQGLCYTHPLCSTRTLFLSPFLFCSLHSLNFCFCFYSIFCVVLLRGINYFIYKISTKVVIKINLRIPFATYSQAIFNSFQVSLNKSDARGHHHGHAHHPVRVKLPQNRQHLD